ncbi:MAG: creatininase family protein [Deltaproteobacteria bacterium]|nr:creatininase family protein [Deltaproteobacteria bacterium]MBW2414730.1 creatininase family protein [Deltaproteobacteria bacterium]
MTAYIMEEMTWPEVRDALGEVRVAVLPVGSCEQHGPHLALSTDIAGADVIARRLVEEVHPLGMLAPSLRFGVSIHHMPFAGTITLQPETFQTVLMEVADSLRQHGIRRLFVVNGHGGNQNALGLASARMRRDLGVRMAYTLWPIVGARAAAGAVQEGKRIGHACVVETSMMMHLRPDLVREDALAEGEIEPPIYGDAPMLGIEGFAYWNEYTANGALEGAPDATADLGEKIARASLDGLVPFVRRFAEVPVD